MGEQAALFSPIETAKLRLVLPWPPSVNAYWRARVAGKIAIVYTTHEAKAYRENVRAVVWQKMGKPVPLAGELVLDLVLHPPDVRRRDADNFNKCVWDSLRDAGVFVDDCQVQSYRVTKGVVVRGGAVVVELWERSIVEAKG